MLTGRFSGSIDGKFYKLIARCIMHGLMSCRFKAISRICFRLWVGKLSGKVDARVVKKITMFFVLTDKPDRFLFEISNFLLVFALSVKRFKPRDTICIPFVTKTQRFSHLFVHLTGRKQKLLSVASRASSLVEINDPARTYHETGPRERENFFKLERRNRDSHSTHTTAAGANKRQRNWIPKNKDFD